MIKTFHEISDATVIYSGELTESIKGHGGSAVKVRDLKINHPQDINGVFKSLMLKQVITLVVDGRQIDFYKLISKNGIDIYLSTHP